MFQKEFLYLYRAKYPENVLNPPDCLIGLDTIKFCVGRFFVFFDKLQSKRAAKQPFLFLTYKICFFVQTFVYLRYNLVRWQR